MYLDAPRTRSTRVSFDLVPSPPNSTDWVVMKTTTKKKKKKTIDTWKKNTVRTLPRLLHVDRLSSLSHCRGPSGPPKCSLCRLHRQLRTGRLIIVTSFLFRSRICITRACDRMIAAWDKFSVQFPEDRDREVTAFHQSNFKESHSIIFALFFVKRCGKWWIFIRIVTFLLPRK